MRTEADGDPVDLGDGWVIPSRITVTSGENGGYEIEVGAQYAAESGRYEVEWVTMRRRSAGEVTAEALRIAQVAGILRQGVVEVVTKPFQRLDMPHPRDLAAQGPTDETLRWVSRYYRLAVLFGDAPIRRIAEALGVPRSRAAQWVTRARDRGFLTVTDPRGRRQVVGTGRADLGFTAEGR